MITIILMLSKQFYFECANKNNKIIVNCCKWAYLKRSKKITSVKFLDKPNNLKSCTSSFERSRLTEFYRKFSTIQCF